MTSGGGGDFSFAASRQCPGPFNSKRGLIACLSVVTFDLSNECKVTGSSHPPTFWQVHLTSALGIQIDPRKELLKLSRIHRQSRSQLGQRVGLVEGGGVASSSGRSSEMRTAQEQQEQTQEQQEQMDSLGSSP